MKRGQGDAIVMFSCGVTNLGLGYGMQVYRGTPKSEILKRELLDRLRQAQFEPAVYRGVKQAVYLFGTVVFAIVDGKPHVRIFLNQEEDQLNQQKDFIAPQMAFVMGNTKFKGIYYPPAAPGYPGVAAVTLDVDATGKVQNAQLSYEHPANMHFGDAAAGPLPNAVFIPGFRNGKAVSCRFTMPVIFSGPGYKMTTG